MPWIVSHPLRAFIIYRVGQVRTVMVRCFITKDTIEEIIFSNRKVIVADHPWVLPQLNGAGFMREKGPALETI